VTRASSADVLAGARTFAPTVSATIHACPRDVLSESNLLPSATASDALSIARNRLDEVIRQEAADYAPRGVLPLPPLCLLVRSRRFGCGETRRESSISLISYELLSMNDRNERSCDVVSMSLAVRFILLSSYRCALARLNLSKMKLQICTSTKLLEKPVLLRGTEMHALRTQLESKLS